MPATVHRRPALILLVLAVSAGCLALGWWQWSRFQAAGGTFQNLGYALQWPLFAWFFVFAYRRFVRYEVEPPEPDRDGELTEIPAGLLPERPPPAPKPTDDPVLAEYNAYLAELADAEPADAEPAGAEPAGGNRHRNIVTHAPEQNRNSA